MSPAGTVIRPARGSAAVYSMVVAVTGLVALVLLLGCVESLSEHRPGWPWVGWWGLWQ